MERKMQPGYDPHAYEMGAEEFIMDVMIPCIPLIGLIVGLLFGLIDLQYDLSRTQGVVRVASAIGSHAIYALIVLVA